MKESIHKLQNFFRLEAERGYDNRAVVGGLDRILSFWEVEARSDGLPEDLIQAVGARLRDYHRLNEASRAESLVGLWRRVERETEAPGLPELERAQQELQSEAEETPASEEPAPTSPPADLESASSSEEPVKTYPPAEEVQGEPAALEAPVTVIQNVGPRHAQTLGKLGLHTLRDMLYNFPRRYDDYSQLKPINRLFYGEEVTVIGTIQSVKTRPVKGGKFQVVEAVLSDGTGAIRLSWFNQPWVGKRLHSGSAISVSGKIDQYLGRLVINNPEYELLDQQQISTNRIVPVYPLTAKITQRWLRRIMNQVVTYWAARTHDYLPESLRQSAGLMPLSTALLQMHFPDSWDELKAARHRLAFDEILLLQIGVLRQKRAWENREGRVIHIPDDWLNEQIGRLPYALTNAQKHAIADIQADFATGRPMNRLLQGDVGSGKTAVAAVAIAMVTAGGAQAALMAPTSILAEQHARSLTALLSGSGNLLSEDQVRLLVGATPAAEKEEIRQKLSDGEIKLLIGTHALIEDPVEFQDLQLAIVDEQHRFGVEQRATLRSKGANPHLLVITATPIPRSLALTVYGDLDLSVMDEMPPGRQEVSTHVLTPRERERAYSLIRSQVKEGRQAFIIYPLVEESDKSEAKAAVDEHDKLQKEVFPYLKLGLLHGRLRPQEKEEVMARFHAGEYHILVSTSVIEVGVDVPNATVMLIEGANRFGLAQLHQFRGRVGRGAEKSYCLLIPESADAVENERLLVMARTNDGFELAEQDLEQRGPGEFLGTRQSGFSELQLANLTDVRLIEKARHHAQLLFNRDPDLEAAENQALAAMVDRFWSDGSGDVS
jgi:ATP-dependent DNA helicase RecG